MSVVIENLRRDTQMRAETDKKMSVAWIILPIIPFILIVVFLSVLFAAIFSSFPAGFNRTRTTGNFTFTQNPGFGVALSGIFGLFFLGLLAAGILYAFLLYQLVKRRNTHFRRQTLLYEDLVNFVRESGRKKGIDVTLAVNSLDRTLREARIEETEKSAGLWAILSFVPYVGGIIQLYIYYFLNKDFFKHERKEDQFVADLTQAMTALGLGANLPPRIAPIPDRSFILYFILTLFTFGIFGIYWMYTLITDPNNHFRHQSQIEDVIIATAPSAI